MHVLHLISVSGSNSRLFRKGSDYFNSIPLISACTARPGLPLSPPEIAFLESPYYRPQTASTTTSIAITQQTFIQSPTHKTMTLHSKPDTTMNTNNFCACGLFLKWNIRQKMFCFRRVLDDILSSFDVF